MTTPVASVEQQLGDLDTSGLARSLVLAFARSATHPADASKAALAMAASLARIGPSSVARALGAKPDAAAPMDRRFADPAWDGNPAYHAIREAYLATHRLGDDLIDAGSLDPVREAKARFAWQLVIRALAPTNFFLTNPAALRKAVKTGGWSVILGTGHFLDDLARNGGKPTQVDSSSFELGRNLAATPGQVVYRNELIELIQYAPQTSEVHAVPLLASPPWINKYYVMDLAPQRSFLEWAVQHGRTVFAISYRNPDASMCDVTLDDYLMHGPKAAIDVIREITGAATVDIVGLCLGGVLAAMTAAYLAETDPERIGTLTLLNTLLDYDEPGVLGVFTDEPTVAALEKQMSRTGFLDGAQMASTFDSLRPDDLIFNYVASSWLLGEKPKAFDILAWNADNTRMPARMHTTYLRSMYVQNLLAIGKLEVAGQRLDLGDVTSSTYVVGAINDHIVPWTSSYAATHLLGADVRYVLSSGGHIAGIVNPPTPKAWFEVADPASAPTDPTAWRAAAQRQTGSWWEDWTTWSDARAGALTQPPTIGSVANPPIADSPGTYVLQ